MRPNPISTLLLLLLFPLLVQAQPDEDLNLGGEDPLVTAVADSTVSQFLASLVWWQAVERVDSLQVSPPLYYSLLGCRGRWPGQLVAEPGQPIPYSALTVFTYLEDLAALETYFLHRAYQIPESRTGNLPGSIRVTDRITLAQRRFSMTTDYPLVRKYRYVENGLAPNPNYQELLPNTLPMDLAYLKKYERHQQLSELYHAALIDPVAVRCPPSELPEFYYEEALLDLDRSWKRYNLRVLTPVDDELERQFELLKSQQNEAFAQLVNRFEQIIPTHEEASIGQLLDEWSALVESSYNPEFFKQRATRIFRRYQRDVELLPGLSDKFSRLQTNRRKVRPPRGLTEAEIALVIPTLEQTPLPLPQQRYLDSLAQSLSAVVIPLREKQEGAKTNYFSTLDQLQPLEVEFFRWVLGHAEQVIRPLEATVTYARQVAALPNSQTNYTQLVVVGELLRISSEQATKLAMESKTAPVTILTQLTQNYYAEVLAAAGEFARLKDAPQTRE